MKTRLPLAWRRIIRCARSVSMHSLFLVLTALIVGCSLLPWDAELPSRAFKTIFPGMNRDSSVDRVDVQEQLLRSANIFLTGVNTSIEKS